MKHQAIYKFLGLNITGDPFFPMSSFPLSVLSVSNGYPDTGDQLFQMTRFHVCFSLFYQSCRVNAANLYQEAGGQFSKEKGKTLSLLLWVTTGYLGGFHRQIENACPPLFRFDLGFASFILPPGSRLKAQC